MKKIKLNNCTNCKYGKKVKGKGLFFERHFNWRCDIDGGRHLKSFGCRRHEKKEHIKKRKQSSEQ